MILLFQRGAEAAAAACRAGAALAKGVRGDACREVRVGAIAHGTVHLWMPLWWSTVGSGGMILLFQKGAEAAAAACRASASVAKGVRGDACREFRVGVIAHGTVHLGVL